MICHRCDRYNGKLTAVSLRRPLDLVFVTNDDSPLGPPVNAIANLCYPCLRDFNNSETVKNELRRKMNYDNENWSAKQ